MRITKLVLILLTVLPPFLVDAQHCDNVIFPGCPGDYTSNEDFTQNTNLKTALVCDTAYIITPPMFGTVKYVSDPDSSNFEAYKIYKYETNTNCEVDDFFQARECCVDSMGVISCDTIDYMVHLVFQCETPDDLFCCVPPDGTLLTFEVLQNDNGFVDANYPGAQVLNFDIVEITDPSQANTELVLLPNNTFQYSNATGMESLDDFSYLVSYEIVTADGDTIVICDEQTCYILVEDCLNTRQDDYCIAPGETLCIEPLANDTVEPTLHDPILDSLQLECQNQLPSINPASLSISPQAPAPALFSNGACEYTFSSSQTGTFTYTYEVCTSLGACETETITVKVEGCYSEELVIDGDFDDESGSTFEYGLPRICGCEPQSWCIATNPRYKCSNNFWRDIEAPDGCSPTFLIVDGFHEMGLVWSQPVHLEEGKQYEFSFWYYPNISGNGTPDLEIRLNGVAFAHTAGEPDTWTQYTYMVSGIPDAASLEIFQTNSPGFSDYAIDHISFHEVCPPCEPVIDLGTNTLYTNTIHAQYQVITAGTIPAGENVSLKAGQCIRLDAGFNSNANADLQIIIEECIPE